MYMMQDDTELSFDEAMEIEVLKLEYANKGYIEPNQVINELCNICEEYNNTIQQIYLAELKILAKTGNSIFNEVGSNGEDLWSRFLNAAKTFMSKVLDVIIKLWNTAIKKMDELIISNDIFVNKYKKKLAAIDNVEFNNGYKFRTITPPRIFKITVPDKLKDINDTQMQSIKDAMVKVISNEVVISSQMDFKTTIHNFYYGNLIQSDTYDIATQLEYIKSANKDKNILGSTFSSVVTELKVLVHTLNMIKTTLRDKNEVKKIIKYIELCKFNAETLMIAYGEYVKAIIDRNRQARAICIKALYDNNSHAQQSS